MGHKIFCQFLRGSPTMADAVLCFGTHLGKGEAACFSGSEDWVVSESTFAGTLRQYLAFHDAFEEVGVRFWVLGDEGYDGTEAGLTVVFIGKYTQQLTGVGQTAGHSHTQVGAGQGECGLFPAVHSYRNGKSLFCLEARGLS